MKIQLIVGFLFLFSIQLEARLSEVDSFLDMHLSNAAIISSKQIKIPHYPNAYNPSIIPYKDGYLLSFRFINRFPDALKNQRTDASFIGLAQLDKKLNVSEESVQLLNIASYSPYFSLTAEDGRLILVGEKIYLFFNDLPPSQRNAFSMYFAEIVEVGEGFILKEPAKLLNYPKANEIEKNWSPFVSEGKLYVIYSDQPRILLEVNLNTGDCHEIPSTEPDYKWDLGSIRGGSPAGLIGDKFLTFFHSTFPTKIPKKRAYVMGAYTFDKESPFAVHSITTEPLGALTDYTQNNSFKVIFPTGMVVQNHSILVTWGKGDKQIWLTVFDTEKLLNSMQPVQAQ